MRAAHGGGCTAGGGCARCVARGGREGGASPAPAERSLMLNSNANSVSGALARVIGYEAIQRLAPPAITNRPNPGTGR